MKMSNDRIRFIAYSTTFFIGLVWFILIEAFDIYLNPGKEFIFLSAGGISIIIGVLLAIPVIRLDMKGENLDLRKKFWHLFVINNFFWFGVFVLMLYLTR